MKAKRKTLDEEQAAARKKGAQKAKTLKALKKLKVPPLDWKC